jgi:flavodoxin
MVKEDFVMKKIFSLSIAMLMAFSVTACGNSQTSENNDRLSNQTSEQIETETSSEAEIVSSEQSEQMSTNESKSNILVAYFSLADEQYSVGVIKEGNTSIIAHMIADQTVADVFEIEPVTPYPETYNELLEVSQDEIDQNARPEIAGIVENMEDYDTVFIGYPIWWGDMPMIVYNFLESYDFTGKTIIPFCTSGGSGLSGTEKTIADITGAKMLDGFSISGETAQNNRESSQKEVNEWLNEIGMVK